MRLQLSARLQAIIVLALVATFGALAGILADRRLARPPVAEAPAQLPMRGPPGGGPAGPGGMGAGQLRYIEALSEQLELTPAQRAAIDSIVAEQRHRVHELQQEVQPRFRQIAEQTRIRIDQVLTDAQRQEMRRLRQARLRQERPRLRNNRIDG